MPEYSHDTPPQRIMKCDADVHEEMCTYVVLSGDTTMFQDIGERMPAKSAPISMQIKVICPPERNHSMYIGQANPISPSVAQACAGAPRSGSQVQQVRCSCTEIRQGRVILVRAALFSVEEAARISRESVPNEWRCYQRKHDGSMIEGLASYQAIFQLMTALLSIWPSAKVRRETNASLAPGTQTEACEIFNTGRWTRPLRQEYQAQETASRARVPAKECQVQRKR